MPNWCQNILIVTGNVDEVARFQEAAKPDPKQTDADLTLGRLYPIPKGVKKGNFDLREVFESRENNAYVWCEARIPQMRWPAQRDESLSGGELRPIESTRCGK